MPVASAFLHAVLVAFLPNCPSQVLGDGVIDHSCFHAKFGPFVDVGAAAPLASTAPPSVSRVHTHFTVIFPAAEAPGTVTYVPTRTGAFSVMTGKQVPITVRGADDLPVEVSLMHSVAMCPALPTVSVFSLVKDHTYRLTLGSVTEGRVGLVIEHVDDFAQFWERDADGDGHGSRVGEILTACAPGPGYVESDDDCDDSRLETFPGAVEFCNGRDDNCDGRIDEACVPGTDPVQVDASMPQSADAALPGPPKDQSPVSGCSVAAVNGRSGSGRALCNFALVFAIVAVVRKLRRRDR